ncbi:hypothetical protein BP6252_06636 [Coleophoma cylindrospora]|uniref:O-methyltransferase domain-containing protein n=1 Tax=Coleophoma cylindrospora TaxID=1849047 RepID=A0A3D8RNM3_9HELO|nr:hypothetical protein BP6252_06636 [Coleophoma cylindrospora]
MLQQKDMMLKQNAAIKDAMRELNAAVDSYLSACESAREPGEIAQLHVALMDNVRATRATVYGPMNMVTSHFEEFMRSSCLRAVMEMGVIEALPTDGGSLSAAELSAKLQVEEALLVRLLRLLVPTIIEEPSPEVYAHTANSMIFLFPPLRAGFMMMFDEFGPPSIKMNEFFQKNGFKTPSSLTNNPFTYAHNAAGNLNMFEILSQDPQRLMRFEAAMQAQTSQNLLSFAIFPFQERFSELRPSEEDVLLVDIGGGKGHAIAAIRELCPDTPGKMILQDRPDVIAGLKNDIAGAEKFGYNFFEPQPVEGAFFYYIRRCLHDWPDNECVLILQNIVTAMKPRVSKLLIAEIVLPPGDRDTEAAWMDITMLAFGGMERSEKQWMSLLDRAGLVLEKIHKQEGTKFSVLEADLK